MDSSGESSFLPLLFVPTGMILHLTALRYTVLICLTHQIHCHPTDLPLSCIEFHWSLNDHVYWLHTSVQSTTENIPIWWGLVMMCMKMQYCFSSQTQTRREPAPLFYNIKNIDTILGSCPSLKCFINKIIIQGPLFSRTFLRDCKMGPLGVIAVPLLLQQPHHIKVNKTKQDP